MIELSNERIEEILHKETKKTEEPATIMRAIYTRYMRLYEKYFADIDALNDNEIARMKNYHEETISLLKYYYMDIPMDVCTELKEFDDKYGNKLLGPGWRKYLDECDEDFRRESRGKYKSEEERKTAFAEEMLEYFYDAMDYIFRTGFGTGSKTAENMVSGIANLFFGKS